MVKTTAPSILKKATKKVKIKASGKSKKEAFANAFMELKKFSYQLGEDLLVEMRVEDVILLKENQQQGDFAFFRKAKQKIELDLEFIIEYKFLNVKQEGENK